MSTSDSRDVVIVGGGIAGLVTAARASELGLTVTLLEKGDAERYPCNARYSGGVFHVAFNDVKSGASVLRQAIDTASNGHADAAQAEAMANHAPRLVDWLRTQGAQFIRTQVAWQNFILAPPRPIQAGLDWMGRGPDVLLRRLVDRVTEKGGRVERGVRARALIMADGACAGVECDTAQGRKHYIARAVVLADGGFQANLDSLGRHIAPKPEGVKQRGAATGMGDGIRMAAEAGAVLTPMDRFYGHLLCRDAMSNDKVWPYPELDALATAGILVNAAGHRFVDEGIGGVALANALARTEDPLGATIIFDAKIWDGPGKSARIPANPTLERAGGTILRADTLADLAGKAGISAEQLEKTIATYNGALQSKALPSLAPQRTTERFAALPIETRPYYAIPVCAGITYTMGGILIDGDSRVLGQDRKPLPGLYAAGSTTGGLEGGPRSAYIGGLTKAGVQALLAAEHIAQTLKS